MEYVKKTLNGLKVIEEIVSSIFKLVAKIVVLSRHMTSRGCPLKVLMSRTYRGPSRDSQGTNTKTDDLMKKLFLEAIVHVLHISNCFLQEEQIFKISKWVGPRDRFDRLLKTS